MKRTFLFSSQQSDGGRCHRRLFSLLLAGMLGLSGYAEKKPCVMIYETQGQPTAFDLEQRPVITYTDTDVKLVCGRMEVLYPLDHYLKLTIEDYDASTDIQDVVSGSYSITSQAITARGVKEISLYTIDGRILMTGKADKDGIVTLSIADLVKGIYVVSVDNKAFKITKK